MHKLWVMTLMLLPLMTACSDDDLQGSYSGGLPTSAYQSHLTYEEEQVTGIATPVPIEMGEES